MAKRKTVKADAQGMASDQEVGQISPPVLERGAKTDTCVSPASLEVADQVAKIAESPARRILRDEKGRVLPGSVLNPAGKTESYWDIIRLARSYAPEAVRTLATIMREGERESDRLHAAEALLDRGLGKASQHVEISTDGPASSLTDQALRMAAAEIMARLPAGAVIEIDAPREADAIRVENSAPNGAK